MNTIKLYSNLDKSIRPFVAGVLANLAIAILKFGIASLGGSRLVLMDGLFLYGGSGLSNSVAGTSYRAKTA